MKRVHASDYVTVCETCNTILARDGELVERRQAVPCSHLRTANYVRPDLAADAAAQDALEEQRAELKESAESDEFVRRYG